MCLLLPPESWDDQRNALFNKRLIFQLCVFLCEGNDMNTDVLGGQDISSPCTTAAYEQPDVTNSSLLEELYVLLITEP